MPDWLQPTLILFPYAAWIFFGVGIPWALVLLPRDLWDERITVIALGMALGPLGVTLIMLALGTAGRLTFGGTLIGSGLLAAVGIGWARRIAARPDAAGSAPTNAPDRGGIGRKFILAGIVLLVLLNLIVTAYWPFLAYDVLWVFGYNARVFVLEERIPTTIGYYPQLIPLSYTTMQQAWGALGHAAINDHAARVVIPWFNLAAILMAYQLGWRAFRSSRVALLSAAVWALYPHVAAWSGAGDLEIALTLYCTGSAAFFIEAWRTERARFAVISGVLLAGALWTKPTGGALALGMVLAVGGFMLWVRQPGLWWPKLRLLILTGIVCAPVGGVWYGRNLLLGHKAVTFPAAYWHDFAQRSGQELGWPLLLAALVVGGLLVSGRTDSAPAHRRWLPLLALGLLIAGALPTAIRWEALARADDVWRWVRGDFPAGPRMGLRDGALWIGGAGLLATSARGAWQRLDAGRQMTILLLWALLLPYGGVWFRSFSYHYRLSFAIVPLIGVQVAALIDGWLWDRLAQRRIGQVIGGALLIGVISTAATASVQHSADAWLNGDPPDDRAKYDWGNPALMVVVHALERYADDLGRPPVVAIPGEDRLPFFFPTWEIRNSRDVDDLPVRLEDLDGVDVFINSSPGLFLLNWAGKMPNSLQADANKAVAYHQLSVKDWDGSPLPMVLNPIPLSPDGSLPVDDGNFRYTLFTLNPSARTFNMQPNGLRKDTVIFGDFARFVGFAVTSLDLLPGEKISLLLYWQPTDQAPPAYDYSIYIHLLDADGQMIAHWDGQPGQNAYPTRFWRPGESILDYWALRMPTDLPSGAAQLRFGIYDPASLERLPVTIDGQPSGDGVTLPLTFSVK
jgi:hypothetical protein